MTLDREGKIARMTSQRFLDLEIILENVDDPHNLGAILRTCDAVGVGRVHLVYTVERPPRMAELRTDAAASAAKWLTIVKWGSLNDCLADLKSRSRRIIATALSDRGVPQWDADFSVPCAIAVGNEHDGLSAELLAAADEIVTIPMRGMVQSLNVSVAAAVILEEALRQRMVK